MRRITNLWLPGCWLQVTGHWVLVAGYWLEVTRTMKMEQNMMSESLETFASLGVIRIVRICFLIKRSV